MNNTEEFIREHAWIEFSEDAVTDTTRYTLWIKWKNEKLYATQANLVTPESGWVDTTIAEMVKGFVIYLEKL